MAIGPTRTLTAGRDNFTGDNAGTADDDTFDAWAGPNQLGQIVNSLQTGDQIDGGAGTDTLDAEIFADGTFAGATAVRPITESVENVFVNALAEEVAYDGDGDGEDQLDHAHSSIRLNADRMDDLEQIWSNGSEASLRVENVANPGDTEDLSIGMRSTGNAGSTGERSESNYEVYFQEDELSAGQSGQGSFVYDLLNQASFDANNAQPIDGFPLESIRFDVSFDGAPAETFRLSIEDGDLDGVVNHEQLVSLLNNKLDAARAEDPRLNSLGFEVSGTFTDPDGRQSDRIQLTDNDPTGREITLGTVRLDEEADSGNLYFDTAQRETSTTNEPVTATVVLDDVGRGSDGGFLRVGSMSEGSTASTGIEVYDLTVQRDSSLSSLTTTNGTLEQILITSDGDADGDLAIGNQNSDESVTQTGLNLVQTSGFNGNLSLGLNGARVTDLGRLNTTDMGAEQTTTFFGEINTGGVYSYNTGGGADNLDVNLDGDAVNAVGESFALNSGGGNDTVEVRMDTIFDAGVSQATMVELDNLSITTGAGEDDVELIGYGNFRISTGEESDFVHINSKDDSASLTETAGPQIATVTLGEQPDDTGSWNVGDVITYTVDGVQGTYTVQAGDVDTTDPTTDTDLVDNLVAAINGDANVNGVVTASTVSATEFTLTADTVGDSFTSSVSIDNSVAANTVTTPGGTGGANTGMWTSGDLDGTGPTTWNDRVLYEANLTVSFAGFEQQVDIPTDASGNFVATQLDINNAIIDAVESNPELNRLLDVEQTTGTQQLIIRSTVEGDNDFTIAVNQPQVVASGATTTSGQVNLNTAHIDALEKGFIETSGSAYLGTNTLDSATIDQTAADGGEQGVLDVFDGASSDVPGTLEGSLNSDGTVGGNFLASGDGVDGTDESRVENFSTIDMGTGSNDLVVLNSHDDSANTLLFSDSWGKVSVVNFFDDQGGTVGDHILDFTNWLDDQSDASAPSNNLSAVRIGSTSTVENSASIDLSANEVAVVNDFAQNTSEGETWDALTADLLEAALNDAPGDNSNDFGSIADGAFTAAGNLVGDDQSSIMMIEDDQNDGAYKVFSVEVDTSADPGSQFSAEMIGVVDFGTTVDASIQVA